MLRKSDLHSSLGKSHHELGDHRGASRHVPDNAKAEEDVQVSVVGGGERSQFTPQGLIQS